MSYMPISFRFNKQASIVGFALMSWLIAFTAYGQTQQSTYVQELKPNQTLEREMMGAEAHSYRITLKANEFFQVRVEQRGVDVLLKLLDMGRNTLVTMDSPNSKQGPETLSFVAEKSGSFVLEVSGFDAKAERGQYLIHREAARIATAKDRRRVDVERLFVAGITARDVRGQAETAIKELSEAKAGWEELSDNYMAELTAQQIKQLRPSKAKSVFDEAFALFKEGTAESYRAAIEKFQEAKRLYQESGDQSGVALSLVSVGGTLGKIGENTSALKFYEQALPLFRAIGDKDWEAITLNNIGKAYDDLSEKQKALDYYRQTISLYKAEGKESGGATTLSNIGKVYADLGENPKALDYFDQALSLYRAVGDKKGEATTLNNAGKVYDDLGEKQRALDYYNQALLLYRTSGDKYGGAATLNNIGKIYNESGETQKALTYYNQAFLLHRAVGDKNGEAITQSNIGNIYAGMGEKMKALNSYNQALLLHRAADNKGGEATTLNNIGGVYNILNDKQKALDFYNQALRLNRAVGNKSGEATTLNNIGAVIGDLNEKQKSLDYYNQALLLYRAMGNKSGEATMLNNLGKAYGELGDGLNSLLYFVQALPLLRLVGNKSAEATTLHNLMYNWEALGKPRLAVFYGKLSVNKLQELRGTARGLDNETQKSFLSNLRNSYEALVKLLIEEGQLEQAVQVLNLYQDQQFFDFDHDPNTPIKKTPLSLREEEFTNRYEKTSERIGQIGSQISYLNRQIGQRQPNQQESTQLHKLEADLKTAAELFAKTVLVDAEREFAKPPDESDKIPTVPEVSKMQSALRDLSAATKQKSTILYTLIGSGSGKFYILLITPDEIKAFESPVEANELRKKILQFYALLRTPVYDPRILGEELYRTIFKPIEGELKKTGTQTLMWSLDDSLRYIPIAALWDGEKYLAERYQNVVFTRANHERMTRNVNQNWTGTGFGDSQEHRIDLPGSHTAVKFAALPGVSQELQSIFRIKDKAQGILNGEVFLDTKFTKNSFYEALKKRRPLLHISSHFSLRPGDASQSFLLLGDGEIMTLAEMKGQKQLFQGVELLTLSACDTATQLPDENGREIDGFAELAQRLGAGSVLASLWQVRDTSTAVLMTGFYKNREIEKMNKATALRISQLDLLYGKGELIPKDSQDGSSTKGGGAIDDIFIDKRYRVPFERNEKKPFAHPYYWSPFVLFGNWR